MTTNVDELLNGMSLREKIGQTCQVQAGPLHVLDEGSLAAHFERYPAGSIFVGSEIIGNGKPASEPLRELIARCQRASRVPLSVSGDLENGAGGAVRGLTAFPNQMALAATDDAALAHAYGRWTADEARAIGFNWNFGPVADLALNWLNPVVSVRSLGSDPSRVGRMAAALIHGAQEGGLSSSAKHFPGDGVDFRDQHLCVSVNSLEREAWEETFGRVFQQCIEAGTHSIMAGHIALPWADPRAGRGGRPIPATVSRPILTGLLREELGFDGVIVSDALIMAGFTGWAPYEERILQAFEAGVDVMLWPGVGYFDLMERAVRQGRVSEDRLDESVLRILEMKRRQGLLGGPGPVVLGTAPSGTAAEFARSVAQRSLTLVRNDERLLPLDAGRCKRVLVLLATPHADRGPRRVEPFLAKLRMRGLTVDLMVNGNCLDIRKREEAGERFDTLVCLFDLWTHGLKNTMRPAGEMGECMWTIQLVETMKPIVVSLGSPFLLYDMPWAGTFINAYDANAHTLEALAGVLFGGAPFTGNSPVPPGGSWVAAAETVSAGINMIETETGRLTPCCSVV